MASSKESSEHATRYAIGRLLPKENDWCLAGTGTTQVTMTRTRGAGNGRPNLDLYRRQMFISCSDASTISELTDKSKELLTSNVEVPVEESDVNDSNTTKSTKPPNTR
jgi:hypothetical protein